MRKVIWEVRYLSLPQVLRHCKKCGQKTLFTCSEKFRVNAQQKTLDIWLIYSCSRCNTTWNARVNAHISPQSIPHERLEGFCQNDRSLVAEYAMDSAFLRQNGAEVQTPPYRIVGEDFSPEEVVELELRSEYPVPIKIAALVREKLHLSQAA